jgi:hypothetical protein
MLNREEINNIYLDYGFEIKKQNIDNIAVFSIRSGHFLNADIVKLTDDADSESAYKQFKGAGYACTVRGYKNISEAALTLFKGFFGVDGAHKRHSRDYSEFTKSLVEKYSNNATYTYIESDYSINGKDGEKKVVNEIIERLSSDYPILFLIEAAAGFGKTCTSYELLNGLIASEKNKVPLFTELSRNRQAKLFKYVLLDEIDRSFPQLNSPLVKKEIQNGNVPVILDGFDELLHHSGERSGYENVEPMMETISELLKGKSKIVLTTRRTAIFDGDDFHEWMESHEKKFEIIRIRLKEPTAEHWLTKERLEELEKNNFPIKKLLNPVLLAYLKCISQREFGKAVRNLDSLVDIYYNSMLERERIRQDLRILPKNQYRVMKSIAQDMIEFNYTTENKDYILDLIISNNKLLLQEARNNYPSDQRPTIDELANKLASHAFLDRKNDEKGICFVNEFILGNFCAECILEDANLEWAGDQRFIEPCIVSYSSRSLTSRNRLWSALKFRMEFVNVEQRVSYSIALTDSLSIDINNESISEITIRDIRLGEFSKIDQSVFINCVFIGVSFLVENLIGVTFVDCRLYDCNIVGDIGHSINFISCIDNNDVIESASIVEFKEKIINQKPECEIYILEEFWPKGIETFHKHKSIKKICAKNNNFNSYEILSTLERLKKTGILKVSKKISFVELNLDKICEIKNILGRD